VLKKNKRINTVAKILKSFFIFIILISMVGCATSRPEVAPSVETLQEEVTREMTAPSWLVTPSASVMSDEEFTKLQERVTVSIIEEPEETVEEIPEEIIEIAQPVEEVVEEPVEEVAEEVIEEEILKEEVVEESLVNILADEVEEIYIPEQEELTKMPEMEYEFAGEDYRNLDFVLEEEPQIELNNMDGIENAQVVTYGEYVEEMNPEIITAMASEYQALEEIDMAEPTTKEKVLSFVRDHMLIIEMVILFLAVTICIRIVVKRTKKTSQEKKEEVADEGEEIVRDFQSWRQEVKKEAKDESIDVPEDKPEEDAKVEDYDDVFDDEI
jgi:large-conductance mechanosensitive channel